MCSPLPNRLATSHADACFPLILGSGGIFDPLGFSKGDIKELQTKEIKNGRLAMVAFMGFVFQAQTLYKGPLAALGDHLADPVHNNWTKNIGTCALPASVEAAPGVVIPLVCLWPGL